jgi:hypothetical protein
MKTHFWYCKEMHFRYVLWNVISSRVTATFPLQKVPAISPCLFSDLPDLRRDPLSPRTQQCKMKAQDIIVTPFLLTSDIVKVRLWASHCSLNEAKAIFLSLVFEVTHIYVSWPIYHLQHCAPPPPLNDLTCILKSGSLLPVLLWPGCIRPPPPPGPANKMQWIPPKPNLRAIWSLSAATSPRAVSASLHHSSGPCHPPPSS